VEPSVEALAVLCVEVVPVWEQPDGVSVLPIGALAP
jgi:hypothetical protein